LRHYQPAAARGRERNQIVKTNQFELSGFVGNVPELRFTPNGKTVATFSLYTKERWSGSDGATHEKTQRHQITAWAAQAEFAQQRLIKGTRVQILGRIDQQSWGEGAQRQYNTVLVATEIVLVSFAAPEEAPSDEAPALEQSEAAPVSEPTPEVEPAAPTKRPRRRAKPAV
jgi:single-strand DNA-binding protein